MGERPVKDVASAKGVDRFDSRRSNSAAGARAPPQGGIRTAGDDGPVGSRVEQPVRHILRCRHETGRPGRVEARRRRHHIAASGQIRSVVLPRPGIHDAESTHSCRQVQADSGENGIVPVDQDDSRRGLPPGGRLRGVSLKRSGIGTGAGIGGHHGTLTGVGGDGARGDRQTRGHRGGGIHSAHGAHSIRCAR